MTSQFPPSATPDPDEPGEQSESHAQPDPFGDETDIEGGEPGSQPDDDERPRDDPRGE